MKLAYRFKEIEVEKARDRQGTRTDLIENNNNISLPVGLSEESKGKTLEKLAQKAGVSRATAEQYDAIQRKGTDEQKAQVDSGDSSIKKVYTQIQRAERLEKYQLLNQLPEVA